MKQTYNWVKREARLLMQRARVEDLATLWLSLLMLVVVLLWETLRRALSLIGLTHTVRTHLVARTSTKISIWTTSLKIKLMLAKRSIMMKLGLR